MSIDCNDEGNVVGNEPNRFWDKFSFCKVDGKFNGNELMLLFEKLISVAFGGNDTTFVNEFPLKSIRFTAARRVSSVVKTEWNFTTPPTLLFDKVKFSNHSIYTKLSDQSPDKLELDKLILLENQNKAKIKKQCLTTKMTYESTMWYILRSW